MKGEEEESRRTDGGKVGGRKTKNESRRRTHGRGGG